MNKTDVKRQFASWVAVAYATLSAVLGAPAAAQDYPKAPIRFIYPFAAGSAADVAWRAINDEVGKQLGQPIVFVNRAGAGGRVGFAEMMRSKPDGYTIGLVSNVVGVMQPLIDPVEWKATPVEDYTPIILGFEYPLILVAKPAAPFKDLKGLIAHAKANPGKVMSGSAGIGTGTHFGVAALNSAAGIDITHVPFGGNGPAVTALLGGQTDIMWTDGAAKPHVESGAMIGIGVASPRRWDLLPNVPTLDEAGLPGINLQSWSGVAAPPGLPAGMVAVLRAAYAKVLADPVVRAKLAKDGWQVIGGAPEDVAVRVKTDQAFFRPLVKSANITRQP